MAVFRAIIQSLVRPVFQAGCDLPFGRAKGAKLVRDDPFWGKIVAFHQQNRLSDNLGRETVAFEADTGSLHRGQIRRNQHTGNRGRVYVTTPI